MIEALVLDYIHEQQETKETCTHLSGRAVYLESESILVRRNLRNNHLDPEPEFKYRVLIGPEAHENYRIHEGSMDSWRDVNPKKIMVPDSFVEWARGLYQAQNPVKEVSTLISEIFEPGVLLWPDNRLTVIHHQGGDKKLIKYLPENQQEIAQNQ